ncbi:hypothetical protein [Vibrio cyclitrophicus]|uniref:hypothetical protein n=1 Tax=Vibrio cyclitrophicus TaxID=47951 RepID=UPI0010553048|nr:hypothetical protein [Vibrio cyclitrophicus]
MYCEIDKNKNFELAKNTKISLILIFQIVNKIASWSFSGHETSFLPLQLLALRGLLKIRFAIFAGAWPLHDQNGIRDAETSSFGFRGTRLAILMPNLATTVPQMATAVPNPKIDSLPKNNNNKNGTTMKNNNDNKKSKNKGGAPKKEAHLKQNKDLRCKITKAQKEAVARAYKYAGYKQESDYVRDAVFNSIQPKAIITQPSLEFLKSSHSYFSNFNQLIHALHRGEKLTEHTKTFVDDTASLRDEIRALREEIKGDISNDTIIALAINKLSLDEIRIIGKAHLSKNPDALKK